jgi:hypothetical protein
MTFTTNPLNQSLFADPTAAFKMDPGIFLDYYKKNKLPNTDYSAGFNNIPLITDPNSGTATTPPVVTSKTDAFGNPVPDTATADDWDKYNKRRAMDYAWDKALMQDMLGMSNDQYLKQMQQSYPWLSQAAEESAGRNWRYSTAYRDFADQLPSAVAQRGALFQQQKESASNAFAAEANAIANQMNAASNSWRTTSRLG